MVKRFHDIKASFYPPDLETGEPRRFQTAFEIVSHIELDEHDFGTADNIKDPWRVEAGIMVNAVDSFLSTLQADPEKYKHFLVGRVEYTDKVAETTSPGTSPESSGLDALLSGKSATAPETKSVSVMYFGTIPICPFCFEEGYTVTLRDKSTKFNPAGSHNELKEKDIQWNAKYNKPIAMCYHHQQIHYKQENERIRMNNVLVELRTKIEDATDSDYTVKTIDVEVKV